MKYIRSLFLSVIIAGAVLPVAVYAHAGHHTSADASAQGELQPVGAQTDPAWLAKARADYPLKTCVVSGDEFDGGKMGRPRDYVYQAPGQPDRLVRLCCKDCVRDFNKAPEKYLQKIDAARQADASHPHKDMQGMKDMEGMQGMHAKQ